MEGFRVIRQDAKSDQREGLGTWASMAAKSSGQQESEREVILGGRRDGGWRVAWPTQGVWFLQLGGQQWPEDNAGARICRADDDELGFVIRSIPVLISRTASRKRSVSVAYRFSSFFSGDMELLGSQLLSPLTLGVGWLVLCKRPCIVK